MHSFVLPAAVATTLVVSSAIAQTSTPAFVVPGAAAPSQPVGLAPSNTMAIPKVVAPSELEGGNSNLTEEQARLRIESTGFSNVSDLAKDAKGIWRAKAIRGDRLASIGLDHNGNIAAQ